MWKLWIEVAQNWNIPGIYLPGPFLLSYKFPPYSPGSVFGVPIPVLFTMVSGDELEKPPEKEFLQPYILNAKLRDTGHFAQPFFQGVEEPQVLQDFLNP